jgi:hypothetical protein
MDEPVRRNDDPIEATDAAFLGYGTLDLQEWGQDRLVLGTWVERPVDPAQVDILYQAFLTHGLQAFNQEAHIIIIVPEKSVTNRKQLWKKLRDNQTPPIVKFAPETQALPAAGGQHRLAALAKYREAKQLRVEKVEAKVASEPDEGYWVEELSRAQAQVASTRWWGIQVYDTGAPSS